MAERETFTCSKREKAILKLCDKLGKVSPLCDDAEAAYREQQKIANGLKKDWEALQEEMAAVCTQISSVKNGGDFQPDLFDASGRPVGEIKPPHGDVHQEGVSRAAVTPRDEGGLLNLSCLTTKELVRLCGPEWSEYGLTAAKVDLIRSACEGDTIANLEAMQRTNPSWNRDIKGFGEKWIDKLQDAHSAIRTKFPIPSPVEPADALPIEPFAPVATDAKPEATEAIAEDIPTDSQPVEQAGTILDPTVEAK